jgi:hypothetical protein
MNNKYYTFDKGSMYEHHVTNVVTTSATASNSSTVTQTLTASNASVATGQVVTGTNIAEGTTVSGISSTTLTLSKSPLGSVPLSTTLTFSKGVNNFYGAQYDSYISVIFNDEPGLVKSFNAINYEGSQQKVTAYTDSTVTDAAGNSLSNLNDSEYYNLKDYTGWYVSEITTDQQTGGELEFKEKEGKYFSFIKGETTSDTNFDLKEFSIQGIGLSHSSTGWSHSASDTNTDVYTITFTVE